MLYRAVVSKSSPNEVATARKNIQKSRSVHPLQVLQVAGISLSPRSDTIRLHIIFLLSFGHLIILVPLGSPILPHYVHSNHTRFQFKRSLKFPQHVTRPERRRSKVKQTLHDDYCSSGHLCYPPAGRPSQGGCCWMFKSKLNHNVS
jgi:hypothetical protein